MVKLKNKIKTVESLPPTTKKKIGIITILTYLIITLIILVLGYIIYINIFPFINAIDINDINGKKINITKCNTKDYVIIGKDKSYSLSITNDDCITKYYEGTVILKNNEIIFNKNLKGIVDKNYNIIINNSIFESDKNE